MNQPVFTFLKLKFENGLRFMALPNTYLFTAQTMSRFQLEAKLVTTRDELLLALDAYRSLALALKFANRVAYELNETERAQLVEAHTPIFHLLNLAGWRWVEANDETGNRWQRANNADECVPGDKCYVAIAVFETLVQEVMAMEETH